MQHIKNIIDTDCYLQFDDATEISRFAHRNEIYLSRMAFYDDTYIRFYSDGSDPTPTDFMDDELPVHHYNNITEWVKPPYEKQDDDYYQDYRDSQL